jgi:Ribbon-helix-helix protein, copG family
LCILTIVKRLQILIDEDLDADLEREAARTGRSKGALVRDAVRRHIAPLRPIRKDALWRMVGKDSFEPVAPELIDDVVYGEK